MATESSGFDEAMDVGTSTISHLKALKTAFTITKAGFGAAGGPFTAAIGIAIANRHGIAKIIIVIIAILLLPVLFILMLPGLIFGSLMEDTGALNSNTIINDNIRASREAIVEVLEESHSDILSEINAAIAKLPEGDTASINDSYAYNISVNANLLISQFCASQDNYENINLRKLKSLIRKNKDGLFSYDVATETVTMEVVVEGGAEGENSPEGNENAEPQTKTVTFTRHTYTVQYAGDAYFADHVFHLTDEQKELAQDYAENLTTFFGNAASGVAMAINLSDEVLSYRPAVERIAAKYGMSEYVELILAVMMQESGGRGTDPMQSSECPYNTRYSNSPNAIQDADYSIQVGIQYYADCLREAGCTSPQDMDKLKLSLQGYNYGNGYITWAIQKYGGYSAENALQFSNEQAASHGWSAYGDPEYVPHVLRYYSSGGLFAGLFGGNGQIVSVALTQLGNEGGQKFWSWYGFDSHVAWCACFASWCGDQAGLIESGKMPKFSLCDDGIAWFQSKGKWKSRGYSPAPGTLIFFDWNGDGTSDHVGIVEKIEGSTVYTVEGNSSDAVNKRSYDINNGTIMGYGIL